MPAGSSVGKRALLFFVTLPRWKLHIIAILVELTQLCKNLIASKVVFFISHKLGGFCHMGGNGEGRTKPGLDSEKEKEPFFKSMLSAVILA